MVGVSREQPGKRAQAGPSAFAPWGNSAVIASVLWYFQRLLLSGCAMLLTATVMRAKETAPDWSVRVWVSNGLTDRSIAGVAQTPDGFLWVANRTGLAEFDGARFAELPPEKIGGTKNAGRIRLLQRSRAGGLWLVLDGSRKDEPDWAPNDNRVIHLLNDQPQIIHDGLPNALPNSLAEDASGALWMVFRGKMVVRIADGLVTDFTAKAGLTDGNCALASDRDGRIWFAQDGAIGLFRGERFETVLRLPNVTTQIAGAAGGGLWICAGTTLYRYHEGQTPVVLDKQVGRRANVMLEDRSGGLWIGTDSDGAFHFDDRGLTRIPTSDSGITSMIEDAEGSIWIGTRNGGLNQVRPRTVSIEGAATGLPVEIIRSLCEDPTGRLWAVTRDGVLIARGADGWSSEPAADTDSIRLTCVAADPHGTIWAGSAHGQGDRRLWAWRNNAVTTWGIADGLACNTVNHLLVTRAGDLWVAGSNPASVAYVRDGKLHNLSLPAGVHTVGIRAMAEDLNGDIWIGTSSGGLLRASGRHITDEAKLTSVRRAIRTLEVTEDGSLWIGYATAGLGRLKDGQFAHIDRNQGLHVGGITHILADHLGALWLAGDEGIFRARQIDLADVAEGRASRVQAIRYGDDEGLPGLHAFSSSNRGAMRSRDGRLWFAMGATLVIVNPTNAGHDLAPPAALVTRIDVDDDVVAAYRGILPRSDAGSPPRATLPRAELAQPLPPTYQKLEFAFTSLSLRAPENVHFRYRLHGYDKNWIEAGARRSATYPRLPAGHYRFEVIASNSSGVWNATPAGVAFSVSPFVWQRWWFSAGIVILFTAAVIAIVRAISFRRLRLKLRALEQQAALDKERGRIARDIHDDLGSRLTQISLLSGLALQEKTVPAQVARRVRDISVSAQQGIQSLDETVWAVNPRNDTLTHLVDYLNQSAVALLQASGIRYEITFPDHPAERTLPAEARHHLFLAAKEALNNAVRHAQASWIAFRLLIDEAGLELIVEDNGRGFSHAPDDALADGLRNMRQRMEEIGGTFFIESQPGAGTKISLRYVWSPRK